MVTVLAGTCHQVSGGGLFALGHLWAPAPAPGFGGGGVGGWGGVSGSPQGSRVGLELSTAPALRARSQTELTFGDPSPLGFQQRVLRELFHSGLSVVAVVRDLALSVQPEGGAAWRVRGRLVGGGLAGGLPVYEVLLHGKIFVLWGFEGVVFASSTKLA